MLLTHPRERLLHWLDLVDQTIWPVRYTADSTSTCFFTYKPFPGDLTRHQAQSWAALQCKALSPFESGDHYYYLSTQGLHLWITRETFSGLPETAVQSRLSDGKHRVRGENFHYLQTWQHGVMTACVTTSAAGDSPSIDLDQPWAVKRRLDTAAKSATTWMLLVGIVFICALSWTGAGLLTLFGQQIVTEHATNELNVVIGDTLDKRTQFKRQQATLALLGDWRTEEGHLPESMGRVAERINPLGAWAAKEISWQDRQLLLELDVGNIDIAQLVQELESVDGLSSISIRPHGGAGTWLLEAKFHE